MRRINFFSSMGLAAVLFCATAVAQPVLRDAAKDIRSPARIEAAVRIKLPSPLTLPTDDDSLKVLVIGDMGSGKVGQFDTGRMINTYQIAFPFQTALTVGDNIYGPEKAKDMKARFEDAYEPLLQKGVKFYATLGNHDGNNQKFYEFFNMNGQNFYRFVKNDVSFYALDSTYLDRRQLDWLVKTLADDKNKWKVAYFHHPPYSSGKFHGSSMKMREALHPIFVRYGVDVVFTGHDHFYERVKPQDGITYFVVGSTGQLRPGGIKKNSPLTAAAFDKDMAFLMVEFVEDKMHFQAISRAGKTVDSGVLTWREQ